MRDHVLIHFHVCKESHWALLTGKVPLSGVPQHMAPKCRLGEYDLIANVTFLWTDMGNTVRAHHLLGGKFLVAYRAAKHGFAIFMH